MKCETVVRELSNYLDQEVAPGLRQRMDAHLRDCESCCVLLKEIAGTIGMLADDALLDIPPGYSRRLYRKVEAQIKVPKENSSQIATRKISLGIGNDSVSLGSHLIYFWQTASEFERGIRFLYPGLGGEDHCVVFGHEEATQRVLQLLKRDGFAPASLIRQRRLTVLPRRVNAHETLTEIQGRLKLRCRRSSAIRYVGNLGVGTGSFARYRRDDVLELEAKATALAAQYPSVILCMYDVNTLPGRLILKGGFQTHPLAICGDHLTHNPYYIPESDFLQHLHQAY